MNPMLDIARRRYTAKHYDPAKPLSDEDLYDLLEILRLAPSSVNIQPWHFYVLRSESAIRALAPGVKDFNVERIRNAGAIIIIALERDLVGRVEKLNLQETLDGRFDEATIASGFDKVVKRVRGEAVKTYCAGPDKGEIWAREQIGIALGFLLFAAGGMGVDATTLGGLWFDKVDEILELEKAGRHAVIGTALGHHSADDANASRPKSRFPFEEVATIL